MIKRIAERQALVAAKHDKPNSEAKPTFRTINSAKSEIGKISKNLFDKINMKLRKTRALNQWKITKALGDWFTGINKKQSYFHSVPPLHKKNIRSEVIQIAKQPAHIKDDEIKIIKHCWKSIPQQRTILKMNNLFDVTMGTGKHSFSFIHSRNTRKKTWAYTERTV